MKKKVVNHRDLDVYQRAFDAATTIYALSKAFPVEERYSLTDQIRRSSRSICSNLAEGWRRRRYEGAFIDKLSVAEGEAAETQVWLEFAVECGYCAKEPARELYQTYAGVIATLVGMINHPESWLLTKTLRETPVLYDATTPFDTINEGQPKLILSSSHLVHLVIPSSCQKTYDHQPHHLGNPLRIRQHPLGFTHHAA